MTQSVTAPFTEPIALKRHSEALQDASSRKQRRTECKRSNGDSLDGLEDDSDNRAQPSILNRVGGEDAGLLTSALPSHPDGIRPLGNLYSATRSNLKVNAGLFSHLPDELLIHVLEQLDALALLRIGATCKALYAFARHDELWKTLVVEPPLAVMQPGQVLEWCGSWRATYWSLPPDKQSRLNCTGLYSDTLYRPFYCANLPLEPYVDPVRFRSQIPKLPDLTPEDFRECWADKPFILTEPAKSWKVCREWDLQTLKSRYDSTIFRCEAVDWRMDTYTQYMRHTADESPLYLFDSKFVEKMSLKVGEGRHEPNKQHDVDYTPFDVFNPDLFAALGNERPSHRWLIMGPPRSGSSFHTDPNGTSAWNAVISGRKYWIMSPEPPPGVYVSKDESEVTSPSSIGEWLLGFHEEARKMPGVCEGICEAGEVLHVPGGWYHLVLNLPAQDGSFGDNIAITQNFVPEPRLAKVIKFLRHKPDQVSGFQFSDDSQEECSRHGPAKGQPFSALNLFIERLHEQFPGLVDKLHKERSLDIDQKRTNMNDWQEIVKEKEHTGGSFSFGFGFHEDEEEEVRSVGQTADT